MDRSNTSAARADARGVGDSRAGHLRGGGGGGSGAPEGGGSRDGHPPVPVCGARLEDRALNSNVNSASAFRSCNRVQGTSMGTTTSGKTTAQRERKVRTQDSKGLSCHVAP
jgi:hypothetical protein